MVVSPAVSSRPSIKLAHWIIWPAAPLPRLSMADSASDTAGPFVVARGQLHAVRADDPLGRGRLVGDVHKRLRA